MHWIRSHIQLISRKRNCQRYQGKIMLCCTWLWIRTLKILWFCCIWQDIWTPRWKHHHSLILKIQMPRITFQTSTYWTWSSRDTWTHIQIHHEMRYWCQKRPIWKHCHVRRNNHVPRYSRKTLQRSHSISTINHENQGCCPTRKKILSVDWRINLIILIYFLSHVDHQSGIRWIRSRNSPQKMFLIY